MITGSAAMAKLYSEETQEVYARDEDFSDLPPHLYNANVMSTGQNVASLMYSMQMTGYMFRNAEYRKSLLETLSQLLQLA